MSDNNQPSDRDLSDQGTGNIGLGEATSNPTGRPSTGPRVTTSEEDALAPLRGDVLTAMLRDRNELTWQRKWLFWGGGIAAILVLLCFLAGAGWYLFTGAPSKIADDAGWPALVAVDAVFALLVFVVLSIFWSLAKIVNTKQSGEDKAQSDGEKLASSVADIFKSIKELASNISDLLKAK